MGSAVHRNERDGEGETWKERVWEEVDGSSELLQ